MFSKAMTGCVYLLWREVAFAATLPSNNVEGYSRGRRYLLVICPAIFIMGTVFSLCPVVITQQSNYKPAACGQVII